MILGHTLTGERELVKTLMEMASAASKPEMTAVLLEAGEPIRARMAQMAARSDEAPHIADNIGINSVSSLDGVRLHEGEAAVAIGPVRGFPYGWHLEFGTVDTIPQPFVRPAWDTEGGARAVGRIRGALSRVFSRRSTTGRNL